MKLFLQKNAKFSSAEGPRLQTPVPWTAGGFPSRPPLASGDWSLRLQTPSTQPPPHCDILTTRLPTAWRTIANITEFHIDFSFEVYK